MSKLGGLLGLKTGPSAEREQALPAPAPLAIELDQELFSPIANQLGEDNEIVRNLLADAEYRINELDAVKETIGRLLEPVSKTLRAFEIAKSEKLSLQTVLNTTRVAYGKLRNELAAIEKKASALESECLRLQEDLSIAQEYVKALESAKTDQSAELTVRTSEIADLQRRLQHETAELQAAREENRRVQERIIVADKKMIEADTAMETARHKLAQSDKEHGALQRSLDETLAESARLSRRLMEADNALTASQARLRQLETNLSEAESERTRLALALDETKEKHQSDINGQRMRFEALQARATTSDKLLDEARQALNARAEEIRTFERRLAEATATRNVIEGKLGQIGAGLAERDAQIRDLEQARSALAERNEAMAKAVATRESAHNRAQERIVALDERINQLEAELKASRETAELQIEELTAQLQRERLDRTMAEGALEAGRKDVARLLRELATQQQHHPRPAAPVAPAATPDHLPLAPRLRSVA
jgi:chromosome segregation ATPase